MDIPGRNRVNGEGPIDAKIAIVGEAPGFHEDQEGRPFVGKSGVMLSGLLSSIGINRSDCYLTNVVKYRPPDNDLRRLNEIAVSYTESVQELHEELETLRPNVVIGLGKTALRALCGKDKITDWRGSILRSSGGYKTICTYHPSHLLREDGGKSSAWKRHVVLQDLKRAYEESHSSAIELPSRSLNICRSSLDIYNFINRIEGDYLSIDIEAHKCFPICIGFAYSPYDAISVPLVRNVGFKVSDFTASELKEVWKYVARLLRDPRYKKIGQNFKYDQQKLEMIGLYIDKLYADTGLIMSDVYAELPKNLGFMTSIFTREPFYKLEGKEFNPKKDKIDQLLIYNARDAAVTYEIFLRLQEEAIDLDVEDFYYGFIHRLHDLYMRIERQGFPIDYEQRALLDRKYTSLYTECKRVLIELTGRDINWNSPKQVANYFYKDPTGLKLPERLAERRDKNGRRVLGTNEKVITALLANTVKDPKVREILDGCLDVRRYRKTRSVYIRANPDTDGKMRCSYRIDGTESGRTSTRKMKPPIRPWPMGIPYHVLTKHGTIGADIRTMLIPDPGMILGETDLSQADARTVGILSRDDATLYLMDHADLHRITTGIFIGKLEDISTVDELYGPENVERLTDVSNRVKDISEQIRQMGKRGRHGGNFDMGKNTLMVQFNTESKRFNLGITISEWRAGRILEAFHRFTPKVRDVFHAEIDDFVLTNGYLTNPFGRKRIFFDRSEDASKDWYAQIPQSTTSDHLRSGMLRVLDRVPDLQIIVEAHDAFTWQCVPQDADAIARIIDEEFERPIDFSNCSLPRENLIIRAETKFGWNYKDLKIKWKKDKPLNLAA